MISFNDRVNYYTNNLNNKIYLTFNFNKQICYYTDDDNLNDQIYYEENGRCFHKKWIIDKDFTNEYFKNNSNDNPIIDYDINNYVKPIIELFNSDEYFNDKKLMVRFGDVFFDIPIPVITKTRPTINLIGSSKIVPNLKKNNENYIIYTQKNILINFDKNRHWVEPLLEVDKNDINFEDKDNKIIWRGGFTGFGWDEYTCSRPTRKTLCSKYSNHENKMIDIGPVGDNPYPDIFKYNQIVKSALDIKTQLKSKFIISVEGGDVATNLKWILYSNSVPLMPKPTMCSWLMEDKLEPWIHYVPLDDNFDNLEEIYNWCLLNMEKCKKISNNGKIYMEQFQDEEKEKKITNSVLKKYVDNCVINIINN